MYDLPREPTLPDGHWLACTAEKASRLGYWLAYDRKGYEYVVRSGFRDRQRVAERFAAETPPALRGQAWILPDGSDPDATMGRDRVLQGARRWVQRYLAGERLSAWIHGAPGRGKTQLATWMLADLAAAGVQTERRGMLELVTLMRAGYGSDEMRADFEALRVRCQTVPVLLLDDVGRDASEDLRGLLFGIVDHRITHNLATICTSNETVDGLSRGNAAMDPRLVSRLSSFGALALPGLDYRRPQRATGRQRALEREGV